MSEKTDVNLLIVNTLYAPFKRGGAEVSVQRVAEYLVSAGQSVTVLTLSKETFEEETINGVRIIRWPIDNFYSVFDYETTRPGFALKLAWQIRDIFNFQVYWRFKKLLNQQRFNLVWTNNLSGFSVSVWAACMAQKVPVVHTSRDYYLLSNNVQLYSEGKGVLQAKGAIPILKQWLLKYLSKSLFSFVGISESILNIHGRFVPALLPKGVTVYNSITAKPTARDLNSVKELPKVFGFMGQITESKGIYELFRTLDDVNSKSHLVVAGDVSESIKKAHGRSNISFVGHIKPEEFYPMIDGLLVPSKWLEPFGRVVIEAIANKTPVLCSEQGGLAELAGIFKSVQVFDFVNNHCSWEEALPRYESSDLLVIETVFSDEIIGKTYKNLFEKAVLRSNIQ